MFGQSAKKALSVVLILGLVLSLFTGCARKEPDVIKIGAILPLTGSAAEIAEQHKMGIDLAVEKINMEGGINGKKLEVIYEDDKNDPKEAVNAFSKLADINRLPIIITVMSASSMAVYPIAEKKRVVLFANCGHPDITSLSDWVFRNFPTSKHEAKVMMKFIYEHLKIKNLAVLYINDAFGEGAMNVIRDESKNYGINILISESFEKDATDFKTLISKVIKKNPEAIYIYGYGKANGIVVKQTRELGFKGYILGSYNFSMEPTLSIASQALEGSIFTAPTFNANSRDEKTIEFVSEFIKRYQKMPIWNSVIEYDAINLITQAIKNSGYSGENIRMYLKNYGDFEGIAGKYTYLPVGEWMCELSIKTIKNGEIYDF